MYLLLRTQKRDATSSWGDCCSSTQSFSWAKFQLGNILLRGTELCVPCERPAQLLNRPSFMDAFEGRGGIRAEVLNSGVLAVGDELVIESEVYDDSIL
ncbi:MOSC domain-containing protein [Polynucleobacter necessarius]|uniref:MOSC domain-containing protein n=1 Tax=Polynucleobacter necessarius TaxID=576610 RepID=UPI000E08DD7D